MPRAWIWWQLIVGWLPIWALFTVLVTVAHGAPLQEGAIVALRLIVCGAALGVLVYRATQYLPWPHPFRARFVLIHVLAAGAYSVTWIALNSVIESLIRGQLSLALGPGTVPFLVTGAWLYAMVAGAAYAQRAAEREAKLTALAARSQLAALRAQLHPHFLFNALHTVVQLIPIDPRGAVHAAEKLAQLLRSTLEETRDLVPLAEEWTLVQHYLAIEAIRFGDRLRVRHAIDDQALDDTLPSFALQTLVENAVRHAVATAIDPIELRITAVREGRILVLGVADTGCGAQSTQLETGSGTGLRRLRERLAALYSANASLEFTATVPHGVTAGLRVPQPQRPSAFAARAGELADE